MVSNTVRSDEEEKSKSYINNAMLSLLHRNIP